MSKSRPNISAFVKTNLWRASAGRCQFDGCNKPLWRHDITMGKMNKSYIAHIYAYSENGPRYDPELSPKLETDFSNLMLVCDECHRVFDDKDRVKEYPAERLIKMKSDHEARIELVTGISPKRKTHIILYGAKIGEHGSPLVYETAAETIIPDWFPVASRAIEISLKGSFKDHQNHYWSIEEENLKNEFRDKVAFLKNGEAQHFSIFGLAPQPLLIRLGTLLNDIYPGEIYQLHREPTTWKWLDTNDHTDYIIEEPSNFEDLIALKIELSASINRERVTEEIGEHSSIWSLQISDPHNDFLKNKAQLLSFRSTIRKLFNHIKTKHGEGKTIHVFPAMPVAAAIEFGRVWMPKADLPLLIYDQNSAVGGFQKAISISNTQNTYS